MSEPTRDDLRIVTEERYKHWWPPLTDAEFEAIVDADPRWIRVEIAQGNYELLAEWERHGVRVTQNCDTCNGTGTMTNPGASEREWLEGLREEPCPACGGSGKVPADGVFNVSQFTVDILAEVEIRADAPQYWLVPVEGADDES